MASANLSSFLTQINADIIPATNSSTTSTSTSSPSLPISAKVTLLQAQIDQLSKNISTTLTSNAEEFKRLAAEVGGKEGQLHEIETDVHALNQDQDQDEMENQQQEHFQPPIPQLLTNHQSLISTSSISQNLLLVLKFFHSLAFSIESLEEIMSKSQLNPEEILQGFKNVEEKFGLIGRRSNLATTFFKGEKKEQNAFDLSYLSNHDLTSNLFQRYNDLHFKLDEILKVGWEKALEFGRDREDGMRLSVRKDIEVSDSSSPESHLSLINLTRLMKRKQTFKEKLSQFSLDLLNEIIEPLLEITVNEKDQLKDGKKWKIRIQDQSQSRTIRIERIANSADSLHSLDLGSLNLQARKVDEEEEEEDDPWSNEVEGDSSFTRSAMSLGSQSSRNSIDSRDSLDLDEVNGKDKNEEETLRQPQQSLELNQDWKLCNELEVLVELLNFLDEEFREVSNSEINEDGEDKSQSISIFSLLFLPDFLKLLISHLRFHLPISLLPLKTSLEQVELLRSSISKLHSDLSNLRILKVRPQELEDEIDLETLKSWCKDGEIEKKMIEKISEDRREKGRELVLMVGLKESQGVDGNEGKRNGIGEREEQGWDSVVVEMESEIGLSNKTLQGNDQNASNSSHQSQVQSQKQSQSEEIDVENLLGFSTDGNSNSVPISNPSQIKRPSSSSSNQSFNSNPSSEVNENHPSSNVGGKKLKGKAALGNVRRVVSARDQLGSGPFPDDEEEEDGWGLDENVQQPSSSITSTTSGSGSKDVGIGLEPQEEDVDDDAWGLTEEEIEDRRVKRASMMINSSQFQSLDLSSTSASNSAAASSSSTSQVTINPSQAQSSIPSSQSFGLTEEDEDDIDEDAWGLTEEEQKIRAEKRASRNFANSDFKINPIQAESFSTSTSALPAPEVKVSSIQEEADNEAEEEDDDAWGLSDSQVIERNERRASKLLASESTSQVPDHDPLSSSKLEEKNREECEPLTVEHSLQSHPQDAIATPQPQSSIPRVSDSTVTPFSPQLNVDEEEEDDAWGLSEEQIQERAQKRASRLMGNVTIPNLSQGQSQESESVSVQVPVLEETEISNSDSTHQDLQFSNSDSVRDQSQQSKQKLEDLVNLEDEDEGEDAWGLTVDEQEARAERRASRMLGKDAESNLISSIPSEQVLEVMKSAPEVERHQEATEVEETKPRILQHSPLSDLSEGVSAPNSSETSQKPSLEEGPSIGVRSVDPQEQVTSTFDSQTQVQPQQESERSILPATQAETTSEVTVPSSTTSLPIEPRLKEVVAGEEDEEDDAWGLTSEEKQARANKRTSVLLNPSSATESIQEQFPSAEKEEPLVETEEPHQEPSLEREAEKSSSPPEPLEAHQSVASTSTLKSPDAAAEEEDAWNLPKESTEPLAEAQPESHQLPSLDSPSQTDSKTTDVLSTQASDDQATLAPQAPPQEASETSFEEEHPFYSSREPYSVASSNSAGTRSTKTSSDPVVVSSDHHELEEELARAPGNSEPIESASTGEAAQIPQPSVVTPSIADSSTVDGSATSNQLSEETSAQQPEDDAWGSFDDVPSNDTPLASSIVPPMTAGLAPAVVLSGENGVSKEVSKDSEGEAWSWQDDDSSEEDETSRIGLSPSSPRRTSSPSQSSSTVQPSGIVQPARRGLSPMGRTASPRSTASPQLRQATLRSASAAVTRGAGSGSNTPIQGPGSRSASPLPQRAASNPTPQPQEIERPSTPPVLKEKCSISKRSIRLIKLIEEVIRDATELLKYSSSMGEHQTTLANQATVLLDSLIDILDLHRALMPVAHSEVLINVPSLAMQFANDCAFISKELSRLERENESFDFPPSISSGKKGEKSLGHQGGKLKLSEEARLTTALGKRWFDAQIATQERVLMELLDEADSFARTYEPERFKSCERVIKQVLFTLTQLSSAWAPPLLAPTAYLAALGRLVEKVLTRLLSDIESLDDISETESEKLAQLCREFGPLEEMFKDPTTGQTAVALFVPSWFKASYLSEILTGSLVDIDFLLTEAGALQDYTPRELASLVRALFSDTPNRSKLLEKIERGPSA